MRFFRKEQVMKDRANGGFTMVELMVVVTILCIMVAIAIPNFLAAEVRAKVSSVNANQAMLSIALEAYFDDHGTYPLNAEKGALRGEDLLALKQPITYFTAIPTDPFDTTDPRLRGRTFLRYLNYDQYPEALQGGVFYHQGQVLRPRYILHSNGPDFENDFPASAHPWEIVLYDPTNGTTSKGDICRLGPQ